jgi:uncharacterized membrane protein
MEPTTLIDILSRWAHVGAAIVLVGGSVFMRFMLMPAAAELPDDEHQALRQRIIQRWKQVVMIGIALLLLSGFWNYYRKGKTSEAELNGLYHGLMGTKILLAFGAFFLASALTGRSPALEKFRTDARKWLLVLIALTATVVAIAGFLKVYFA